MIDLFCIDGIDPDGAMRTLRRCVEIMPDGFFNLKILCSPLPPSQLFAYGWIEADINSNNTRLRLQDRPEKIMAPYNTFAQRTLVHYVQSEYFMIVHRDGYILHPEKWTDDFLRCDYVGAPWPHHGGRVGNGGFSLRSRRLALWAAEQVAFNPYTPEDGWLCHPPVRNYAESAGFVWAPIGLAHAFSSECSGDLNDSFGFHGIFPDNPHHLRRYL